MRETNEKGFTLIELMISLVIFSFAIAGVLSVAVSITQGFREQRQAVQAEAAVRVPMDFILDSLRQAGPGVASPVNVQDITTCTSGAITVGNAPGGTYDSRNIIAGTDTLDVIYATGAVATSTRDAYGANDAGPITVNDASQFSDGDYVVITDFTKAVFTRVSTVTGSDLTLDGAASGCTVSWPTTACTDCSSAGAGFNKGATVIRAQHAHFFIADLGDGSGVPALWMDPDAGGALDAEPLAEGIEDMQIAVGIDANGTNGVEEGATASTTDEWRYNISGDTAPVATDIIRAARVTLIARTGALSGKQATSGPTLQRPAAEDHTAATSQDTYRRRVLRTIVELRNNGSSP
ncbi:MAG TPA: PilW family protein [Kofleriaceae bacterium]|jgi:prepilin-type N-terminal cleavage/methylation domain-containing protein|nr:PilW family protein [Kofleriaceae bacterium]